MGIVFKAQDLDLDDLVAIKVLSPDLDADDQELLLRFKREINLNRKIKHPNVARIHDFGTSGDYPYITMEFVPGHDLRTLIFEQRSLSAASAIAILRQIALGTEAAHKLGIVHRDLKSQNVMVEESGAVAILDFGLARGKRSETLTLDSIMIGTPHYMPPEQALGRPTDARSDIYSIGVMAFEALTGHVPYTGESPLVIAMKHVSDPIPDELSNRSDIPAELVAIVLKALAKNPDHRFQTAAELEAELGMVRLATPKSGEMPAAGAAARENAGRPGAVVPTFNTMRLAEPSPGALDTIPPTLRTSRTSPTLEEAMEELSGTGDVTPVVDLRPPLPTPSAARNRAPIVLIVQDNTAERQSLAQYIARFGCGALEAQTGQEALEILFRNSVDLVLMDVKLSDMDGFDVTRILKAQPSIEALPIVLMSDRLNRNRFAFGIQVGATDVLGKPLNLESMVTRMWDILAHRGFIPPAWSELLTTSLRDALVSETPAPTSGIRPRPS
jgi:serine/threonine protein kinase/CheY-like chemotaxis protein